MKISVNIAAIVLLVLGSIWFLQGINLLPGSFMTGQMHWALIGGSMIIAGIVLLFVNTLQRKK